MRLGIEFFFFSNPVDQVLNSLITACLDLGNRAGKNDVSAIKHHNPVGNLKGAFQFMRHDNDTCPMNHEA